MISREAIDFVRRLLEKNPKERMGIKEALEHDWIKSVLERIMSKRLLESKMEKVFWTYIHLLFNNNIGY